MKVILSSNRNPHFPAITEYVEHALKSICNGVIFFNNRDYNIPGRIRDRIRLLEKIDVRLINSNLLRTIRNIKPDLFLEVGGMRILPDTLKRILKIAKIYRKVLGEVV